MHLTHLLTARLPTLSPAADLAEPRPPRHTYKLQKFKTSLDDNPADDITRGKSLIDLSHSCRWNQGPEFIHQSPDHWTIPPSVPVEVSEELYKFSFCGNVSISHVSSPNVDDCKSWDDLIMTTYQSLHGAAAPPMSVTECIETEMAVLKCAQAERFPDEVHALQANKLCIQTVD